DKEMSHEAKKIVPGNAKSSIYSIIKKFSLSYEDEKKLMKYIKQKKCIFISTPFCKDAVDRLVEFNIPVFKIGSGECNNYPLVEYICSKKKPIILSTGMNDIKSVAKSVKIIRKYRLPYALLHCTNIYPTPPHLVRLDAMLELKRNFKDAIIGLSDHTETIFTSLGAIALGASLVEKHFTDNKKSKGPDMSASLDPLDLRSLIDGSKTIFSAMKGKKKAVKEEAKTIAFAFASVAATENIFKGQKLTHKNIFPIRPGTGFFKIKDYEKLIGKIAKNKILKGNQLKKHDI
ncbi:MAG: N-acetylneuraminate synthase family protein, partial [Pelagibacterales bacterium]|nr:N-acetylneuraminate synthase family protein [Pelagibacterales bacterium]